MLKFENVDILDSLRQIMEIHTQHHKDDFDLDTEIIQKLASSENPEDRRLIWLSRPYGTHCLREREVYIREAHGNHVVTFFYEQTKDPILAYALELTGVQNGQIMGNIHELDYRTLAARLADLSVPVETVTITFEDGFSVSVPYKTRRVAMNQHAVEHGNPTSMYYHPESERELAVILQRERHIRERQSKPGTIQGHIEKLRKNTVLGQLQEVKESVSSPDKSTSHKGVPER